MLHSSQSPVPRAVLGTQAMLSEYLRNGCGVSPHEPGLQTEAQSLFSSAFIESAVGAVFLFGT